MVIQRLLLLLLWFWLSNNSLKWKPVIIRREFVQLCCGSTLLYAAVVSVNRLTTWCMLPIASSHCILAVSRDFYPKIHRRLEWNWNDLTCSGQVDLTAATLRSVVELCAWASAHRDKWVNWMGGEVIRVMTCWSRADDYYYCYYYWSLPFFASIPRKIFKMFFVSCGKGALTPLTKILQTLLVMCIIWRERTNSWWDMISH